MNNNPPFSHNAPSLAPAVRDDAIERRAALFREDLSDRILRVALGMAWALKPERIDQLPTLARLWTRDLVELHPSLPDPAAAGAGGLCGVARDLSVPTLVEAYRRGLYPFSHVGRPNWYSPPERCVSRLHDFHMTRRLRGRLRQVRHRVTFDSDFSAVIAACAERRPGRPPLTWITPQIMRAFAALHDAGAAHSIEVWNAAGELVGGGYGVVVGGVFVIESQFSRESQASKIGLCVLMWHLARWGFTLVDNKGPTQNVIEMGFSTIPRADYLAELARVCEMPSPSTWAVETDLPTVAHWQPDAGVRAQSLTEPA